MVFWTQLPKNTKFGDCHLDVASKITLQDLFEENRKELYQSEQKRNDPCMQMAKRHDRPQLANTNFDTIVGFGL